MGLNIKNNLENLQAYLQPKPISVDGETFYIVPYYCAMSYPQDPLRKISQINGFMILNNPKRHYVLWQGTVRNDQQVIGQIQFEPNQSNACANIDYLMISLPYRNKGMGGQLLKYSLEFMQQMGIQNVTLDALPHIETVVFDDIEHNVDITYYLYRKYGFVLGILPDKGVMKKSLLGLTPMYINLTKCDPHNLPLDLSITPKNVDEFDANSIEQKATSLLKKKAR